MILAFLLGSQRLSSQHKLLKAGSLIYSNKLDSCMALSEVDINILLEVLSNGLHCRGKVGPRGYLPVSFSLKTVLYALRCMLTHNPNQKMIAVLVGPPINTLLLKTISFHSLDITKPKVDDKDAENAIFSLYLLSVHSFGDIPLLPYTEGGNYQDGRSREDLSAMKVLVSYLCRGSATSTGRRAAEKLMLRMPFLAFGTEKIRLDGQDTPLQHNDLSLDQTILSRLDHVRLPTLKRGSEPFPDIFDRPIVCLRSPQKRGASKNKKGGSVSLRLSNTAVTYSSAMLAAQELFFDQDDEIGIANMLAESASRQSMTYDYVWCWEDEEYPVSGTSYQKSSHHWHPKQSFVDPTSIWFQCCAADTTTT